MLIDILAIIFTFGVIIFIHELGHFLSGKAFGVKVERFAFGFGPEIVGKTVGETRYSICAVPLGGYVKFAGDEPDTKTGAPREWFTTAWYKRIVMVVAGPAMNYVLAVAFFFLTIYFAGMGVPGREPIVGSVAQGMAAEKAGVTAGDKIISIDGDKIKSWEDISVIVHKSSGKKIELQIQRGENILKKQIIPELNKDLNVGLIGITPEMSVQKVGIFRSFTTSISHALGLSYFYLRYLLDRIIKLEKPDVAGPVGIAQFISKAAHAGIASLLIFIGQISVMIGLMNLFPIPMLDGGHILYYTIEGIIRKPLNKKAMETGNFVGLTILIALMLFAFYSDFQRLGLFRFLK